MLCRNCRSPLSREFIDLGSSPPSNAYLSPDDLHRPEKWYPLRVLTCTACWLVQTEDFSDRTELFSPDYAYFSSVSSTWQEHCRSYAKNMKSRFSLGPTSLFIEVAANDGCLLSCFQGMDIPCMGVEPTRSTAEVARSRGLHIVEDFFGLELARSLLATRGPADLMAANNVLAHVPDIRDFVRGFATLLAPHGVATLEFPHLAQLVSGCQFDTIYHEHFSYLSLIAVDNVLSASGLSAFDVEELPTHGGSLRVYCQRIDSLCQERSRSVQAMLDREAALGMKTTGYYEGFGGRAVEIKQSLLEFLLSARRNGKSVAAYGAAAKGNTLLNYCGIRSDLIEYVVDRSTSKIGKYLPGSRIPIVDEEALRRKRPDFIVLLPWNLKYELVTQLKYTKEWGARLVVAIPQLELL